MASSGRETTQASRTTAKNNVVPASPKVPKGKKGVEITGSILRLLACWSAVGMITPSDSSRIISVGYTMQARRTEGRSLYCSQTIAILSPIKCHCPRGSESRSSVLICRRKHTSVTSRNVKSSA